jgi:hypothetical protein
VKPEPGQRAGDAVRGLAVAAAPRIFDRGQEVAVILVHVGQAQRALRGVDPRGRLFGPGQEAGHVPRPHGGGIGQMLRCIFADRLEETVPRRRGRLRRRGHDQRLVDELSEQARDHLRAYGASGADPLRLLQAEVAREHGEALERQPLVGFQEVVAPIDGGAHRLVARGLGARARRQHLQRMDQARGELIEVQQPGPGRGQLDGEGQTLQARADSGHPRRLAGVLRAAREEQRDRVLRRQRRYRPRDFTRDAEGLAAGGQDAEPRAALREHACRFRGGVDEVLTVVEDEEEVAVAQSPHEGLDHGPTAVVVHAQSRGHGLRHTRGLGDRCQLHPPYLPNGAHRLQGQAGLADPPGTDEGRQPVAFEECPHIAHLLLAPGERREGHRTIAGDDANPDEPVAGLLRRLDVAGRPGIVAEDFADLPDADLQDGIADESLRPHAVEQLPLADEAAGPLGEEREHIEGFRPQRQRLVAPEQAPLRLVQAKRAEDERPLGGHGASTSTSLR